MRNIRAYVRKLLILNLAWLFKALFERKYNRVEYWNNAELVGMVYWDLQSLDRWQAQRIDFENK